MILSEAKVKSSVAIVSSKRQSVHVNLVEKKIALLVVFNYPNQEHTALDVYIRGCIMRSHVTVKSNFVAKP